MGRGDSMQSGAIERIDGAHGPEYVLTNAGQELMGIITALGVWGQRWLTRRTTEEDLDLEPLLIDMRRRVRFDALPKDPLVIRFEIDNHPPRLMLLRSAEASLCTHNPGFPEPLRVRAPLAALAAWWRGDLGFADAQRAGLSIIGPRTLARAFPRWFDRYLFAGVAPAIGSDSVPHSAPS